MGNVLAIPFTKVFEGLFGFNPYGWSSSGTKGPPIGLILLGNTGVGKSLLANILLNEDYFRHDCSPSSVTHLTEWKDFRANKRNYVVFNIPGLIENNQEAIERNKKEIQRAFEKIPYAIIIPVFLGGAAGRLREEDLVAFNVLNNAYKFEHESLLFVINDLPSTRQPFYEGQMHAKLQELVNVKNLKVCFLNRINTSNAWQRAYLRKQILGGIVLCTPVAHRKHDEVVLLVDRLKKLETQMKEKQDEMDRKIKNLEGEIERFQRLYEDTTEPGSCTIL